LPCAKDHDTWQCQGEGKDGQPCTASGKGKPPKKCPKCKGKVFRERKWVCEKCLETAKKHAVRLYDDFLISDFDIDPEFIQINYSGHRGYHVRVHDPSLYSLDSDARVEIVNYIMGLGIRADKAIITRSGVSLIPERSIPGWHGKIADSLIEFISNIDAYEGKDRWRKKLQDNKTDILKGLQRDRPTLIRGIKGLGPKSWKEIALVAAELYGSEIDKPVTTDLRRVIRLIGSLNGKTGLLVSEVTRDQLDSYAPFTESIAFKEGTLRVKFPAGRESPQFVIDDTKYGPYSDESLELPTAAAVFALCKGVAVFE
jgi:DNA primase small subunit